MLGRPLPARLSALRLAGPGLLLGLTLAGAQPAAAQAALASYPASKSPADVAAWLPRATPLLAAQVVDLNTASVTAVTSSTPTQAPRGFQAQVRAEALDPDILAREGILSWSITVEFDCDQRAVRLGDMTGYPGRDLRDLPRVVRRADTTWVNPAERAPLGSALRSLCDADFQRPLAGFATQPPQVASAPVPYRPTTTPPPPASAPAAPPRPARAPDDTAAVYAQLRKPIQGGGSISVQVGASPSQADVKMLLTRVQRRFGGQISALTPSVATVTVGGKTVYRALIGGLRTNSDAASLCQRLESAGQACFIRR